MVTIDGLVILSDIDKMVLDLKFELHRQGINLLNDVKNKDYAKDVLVTCPVHNNGQERNPSCGISKKDVVRNGKLYPTGTVHCFTCGYTADFFEFVARCFGSTDRGYGKRYILQKYNTMAIEERPSIPLNFQREAKGATPYKYIDENILNDYKYVCDYLPQRKFEDRTIYFYEYGYNPAKDTITIPIRDHKGGLVFVKQRFIDPPPNMGKYLNQSGIPKQHILYGFWNVLQLIQSIQNGTCSNKKLEENYRKYGIILTEGEFNASYLFQEGYPAVSLLGRILFEDKTRKHILQKELLLRYGIRDLVVWMDLDEPGLEARTNIINQTYKDFRVRVPNQEKFPQYNDANDFTPEDLDQVVFLGI